MGSGSSPHYLAEHQVRQEDMNLSLQRTHVVTLYSVPLRHTTSRHITRLSNTIQILTQLLQEKQGVQEQIFLAPAPSTTYKPNRKRKKTTVVERLVISFQVETSKTYLLFSPIN